MDFGGRRMNDWATIVLLTLGAGAAMPVGAATACVERIKPAWLENEFRHSIIAFGGGALLSAIALVLVPEGVGNLPPLWVVIGFSCGGLAFMALDILLASLRTPAGQLMAMLSDFIPEALALGAAFASGGGFGPLLAGLMALQNLPEGFNAYRELRSGSSLAPHRIVAAFCGMALLGPIAGLVGYFWLSEFPTVVSGVMLFAAGGILYAVFQDIAPQAKLRRHWAPPLGALAGFLLGLIGHMMLSAQ